MNKEIKTEAIAVFEKYTLAKEVFITPDGQAFLKEDRARMHNKDYETVKRSDVIEETKPEASKEPVASKVPATSKKPVAPKVATAKAPVAPKVPATSKEPVAPKVSDAKKEIKTATPKAEQTPKQD